MYKNIVCVVENLDKARFFYRFYSICKAQNIKIIFVAQYYSVYIWLKNKCDKVIFLKQEHINKEYITDYDLTKTIEFQIKDYTYEECKQAYGAMISCLKKIFKEDGIDAIFSWSGYKIIDIAVKDFSVQNKIKTLFFEISNIKGKLFVDNLGTNAQSSLFQNKKLLYKYYSEDTIENYEQWKIDYIKDKFKQTTVPQAKKNSFSILAFRFISDLFGILLNGLPIHYSFIVFKIKELRNSRKNIVYEKYTPNKKSIILFPLQVSCDVQVRINSDFDLKNAIDWAIKYSKDNNCDLLIKPHPAEKNIDMLNYIDKLKKYNDNVFLVNNNTFELIKISKEVITINSTVALESLIMDKQVIVLGKSFYKGLSPVELKTYITNYLLPIDYFDFKNPISEEQLRMILNRL